MKQMLCLCMVLLISLCGCAGRSAEPTKGADVTLPTSPPVVVPIGEHTVEGVKVTVHKGLLGTNSEVLSDEQKAAGFISGVRNEDDSVTYTIDNAKYDAFVQKSYQSTCTSIEETVRGNFASVTGVTYQEDLSAVTVTVIRDAYEYSVDALVVFALGTLVISHQAYDIDAAGTCVITVLDENGEQVSKTVYPDELIL